MVDHEGHVKEITWHAEVEQGDKAATIFPVLHDYARPQDAPAELLGAAAHSAPACAPAISTVTALEACLLAALAGVLLAWLWSQVALRRVRQPDTPPTAEDPDAPIVLADVPRWPDAATAVAAAGEGADLCFGPACSVSPFVTKVEAFLRFAGIPYSKQVGYTDSAPKGQLPFIQRGGQRIADSHFIMRHLVTSGATPAELLHPRGDAERAAALAVTRMCDTDLAAAIVYERWAVDERWARYQRAVLGPYRLPPGVGWLVARMARRTMVAQVVAQGFGRHSASDRQALVEEELGSLSTLLGGKRFLFSDEGPHAVDAAAFGVLDQLADEGLNPALAALVAAHPNLMAYRARIRETYFGSSYQQEVAWLDGPVAKRGQRDTRDMGAVVAAPRTKED